MVAQSSKTRMYRGEEHDLTVKTKTVGYTGDENTEETKTVMASNDERFLQILRSNLRGFHEDTTPVA